MANTFLKPTTIARTAIGLLYRELVVARTVWTDAVNPGEFTGVLNDTVTLRVPARRTARKRVLRAGTPIVNDSSAEYGVDVKLDTDVYNGAAITDEEFTLDISDFGAQVLMPQIRAVAEGVEDEIVDEITAADYPAGMTIDPTDADLLDMSDTDWYKVATRARRLLNDQHVPRSNRTLLVGSAVEEQILNSDRFTRFDSTGPDASDALREATIGRIAGFNVVPSSALDEEEAYAYHRTAFVLAARAPRVPQGVSFGTTRGLAEAEQLGASASFGGISVRWLMDYDYTNTTDRSLVNTWVGTAAVEDPDDPTDPESTVSMHRAVKISEGS
ncbi:P22 phage major capsid protein family protein [Micromonospora sp. NPDC049891]|uniref:P22 phage major capsid protein family protein n=1 Tax=Micromonospora sp. NPDC049891 TaxID=3155655 RepID=UPI0033F670A7